MSIDEENNPYLWRILRRKVEAGDVSQKIFAYVISAFADVEVPIFSEAECQEKERRQEESPVLSINVAREQRNKAILRSMVGMSTIIAMDLLITEEEKRRVWNFYNFVASFFL